jgi:hypothetical protein
LPRLIEFVRDLAADRGMPESVVLAQSRAGYDPGDSLAASWGVTEAELDGLHQVYLDVERLERSGSTGPDRAADTPTVAQPEGVCRWCVLARHDLCIAAGGWPCTCACACRMADVMLAETAGPGADGDLDEPDRCPRCGGGHDRIDRREPCPTEPAAEPLRVKPHAVAEPSRVKTVAVQPGQRVRVGGHTYTVMGTETAAWLLPRQPKVPTVGSRVRLLDGRHTGVVVEVLDRCPQAGCHLGAVRVRRDPGNFPAWPVDVGLWHLGQAIPVDAAFIPDGDGR